ncbi:hypothetical protein K1719_004509 [Acacia pycnantha]|nr:hypothetical protein K1719_004509 [Acacia pycnantha]
MMMKLMKTKLLRREVCKLLRKKVSGRVVKWVRYCWLEKEKNIPKDVPRGHLVVYVGEDYKRYVIRVSVVNHPLFKALLDHYSEDVFGFASNYASNNKLHIPCSERIFAAASRAELNAQESTNKFAYLTNDCGSGKLECGGKGPHRRRHCKLLCSSNISVQRRGGKYLPKEVPLQVFHSSGCKWMPNSSSKSSHNCDRTELEEEKWKTDETPESIGSKSKKEE